MPANFQAKVNTRYTADSKQARGELGKLIKTQGGVGKSVKKSVADQKKGLSSLSGAWVKVGVAVAGVAGSIAIVKNSFRAFQKDAQLRTAAADADIGRLRKSTRGLIDDQRLLELSAAALNTKFKLTQDQLEQVGQFMLTLRRQGNDVDKVFKQVTKAIVEGSGEGLKEFGVIVEGASGKLSTQKAILKEITEQNKLFADSLDLDGDRAQRGVVDLSNSIRDLKVELGRLAAEGAPALAAIASGLVDVIGGLKGVGDELAFQAANLLSGGRVGEATEVSKADIAAQVQGTLRRKGATFFAEQVARNEAAKIGEEFTVFDPAALKQFRPKKRRKGARGPGSSGQIGALLQGAASALDQAGAILGGSISAVTAPARGVRDFDAGFAGNIPEAPLIRPFAGFTGGTPDPLSPEAAEKARIAAAKQTEAFKAGQQGLMLFADAGVEAFSALIDGSESFADAFERAIGRALKAQAVQLIGESLKESVLALSSLAIGDVRGAAIHGTAAAKAGAAAVAIGGLARLVGGGGAAAPQASAGGAPAALGPAGGPLVGSSRDDRTVIFVVPDVETNPRKSAQKQLARRQNQERHTRTANTVEFG